MKPLGNEPGTSLGLRNHYKFASTCLVIDDSKAVLDLDQQKLGDKMASNKAL